MDRLRIGFALGGLAVALRMASDWLFSSGGPRWYEIAQLVLVLVGVMAMWPTGELVLVVGGNARKSLKLGLWGFPLGLLAGVGDSWLSYGGPRWPSPEQLFPAVAYNVFFPLVEELEFRGFLLGWTLHRRQNPVIAFWLVALMSTLAHAHRFFVLDLYAIAFTLGINAWWTWLVFRTRHLSGSVVAHIGWNIGVLLPTLGGSGT